MSCVVEHSRIASKGSSYFSTRSRREGQQSEFTDRFAKSYLLSHDVLALVGTKSRAISAKIDGTW